MIVVPFIVVSWDLVLVEEFWLRQRVDDNSEYCYRFDAKSWLLVARCRYLVIFGVG